MAIYGLASGQSYNSKNQQGLSESKAITGTKDLKNSSGKFRLKIGVATQLS